eukprot:439933-Heterocapsa_arctica.AAC.1
MAPPRAQERVEDTAQEPVSATHRQPVCRPCQPFGQPVTARQFADGLTSLQAPPRVGSLKCCCACQAPLS